MGLRTALARIAAGAPPVLLFETPGGWRVRALAERVAREQGWPVVGSPAAASLLVVCGPFASALEPTVAATYDEVASPRARCDFTDPEADLADVRDALVAAAARLPGSLADTPPGAPTTPDEDSEMTPAGIALAEGGEDRDDLEMDRLHLPLGPVLPHWPGGLVVDCVLHGDVVAGARARVVARAPARPAPALVRAARWCDHAGAVLALAGPPRLTSRVVSLRDELLTADPHRPAPPELAVCLERLAERVAGSRSLRWSLGGLGRRHDASSPGNPSWWDGDAHDRLVAILRSAGAAAGSREAGTAEPFAPERVGEYLDGLELAAARVVLASLALDVSEVGADA